MGVGRHPGAVWRKVDLQCHTPRDRGWQGSPALPGGSPELDAARRAWADTFVASALDRGLTVVAVTDHHDVAMLPHVMAAAAARPSRELIVFPGIEVTCEDSVQCLAIFDPATDMDLWLRFVGRLTAVAPLDLTAKWGCVVEHCGLSVEALFLMVESDPLLGANVLLVPHFGNDAAHKSLNKEGFAPRSKNLVCDAVYIECHRADLHPVTVEKIQGKISEWGTRRRAILATGDNRNADWGRLGVHDCWIRLGEPSIEALRQSFLADEARVAHLPPGAPSERIVEVEIKSKLTGTEPVRIAINDGFTAFIGGRGSGKSAVLEFLRFGLGKSEADLEPALPQAPRRRERERRLIEETLVGGWVAVTLERSGLRERWHRSGDNPEKIVIGTGGEEERLTVAEAQRRFPARAFHQKELSTTMVNPESAADNITGIAAAEAIDERRRIEREIDSAQRALTTALQDIAAHWQAELELAQARSAVGDLKRRLGVLSERLAAGGVQPADLDVLADAPRYGRARGYLEEVERRIAADRAAVERLAVDVLVLDDARHADAFGFAPVAEVRDAVASAQAGVSERLRAILPDLDALGLLRTRSVGLFEGEQAAFDSAYQAAKDRQAEHGALIDENERLTAQLKEAEGIDAAAAAKEQSTRPAVDRFSAARGALSELVEARLALLKKAAEAVETKSSGTLIARERRDKQPSECVAALCSLLEGSNIRQSDRGCEDWVTAIFAPGGAGWQATCDTLVDIYRAKILAGGSAEPGAEAVKTLEKFVFGGKDGLTHNQASRLYARLTDQSVGLVLSAVPKDFIVLTYVSDGQRISFEQASPGQQASALLELLLRQEAGSLIIDQPEDDLDNRVIMRIVDGIRSSKSSRQIIFATHNPNLVVNGDADKVIVMVATTPEDRAPVAAARVRVEVDGAIETPAVREAVTRIMEGGIDAFDLRARKYRVEGVVIR